MTYPSRIGVRANIIKWYHILLRLFLLNNNELLDNLPEIQHYRERLLALIMVNASINSQLIKKNNDYSHLEDNYKIATGTAFVDDPYFSPLSYEPEIKLKTSIVIPVWNGSRTIEACIRSIEQSSLNIKYPGIIEVIIVDDGSIDGTSNIVSGLSANLLIHLVQQEHQSRAHAMNTGLSIASGDVIFSCDGDMILTYFALEEMVKRHQFASNLLLIGFRFDISPQEIYSGSDFETFLVNLIPDCFADNRLSYNWDGHIYPGWPDNMCRTTNNLKKLGNCKKIWLSDGDWWSLPRMVYGCLFSMRKESWKEVSGFDERFIGWGWEDTFLGAKAISAGCYVIPVFSSVGAHIFHKPRSTNHNFENTCNSQLYHNLLNASYTPDFSIFEKARKRIKKFITIRPNKTRILGSNDSLIRSSWDTKFHNSLIRARYLFSLGRNADTIELCLPMLEVEECRCDLLPILMRVYREKGDEEMAIKLHKFYTTKGNCNVKADVEKALSLASGGYFDMSAKLLRDIHQNFPSELVPYYIFRWPAYKHIRRGIKYLKQEFFNVAKQDFEAALIQDSSELRALHLRGQC